MVEGGTLLRCCTGKTGAAGSNPALSAKRPGTSRAFPFVALGGWSFPFLPGILAALMLPLSSLRPLDER